MTRPGDSGRSDEPAATRKRVRRRVAERQPSANQALVEALSFDQLHDDRTRTLWRRLDHAILDHAINVRDIGMVERRQGLRFACEP